MCSIGHYLLVWGGPIEHLVSSTFNVAGDKFAFLMIAVERFNNNFHLYHGLLGSARLRVRVVGVFTRSVALCRKP